VQQASGSQPNGSVMSSEIQGSIQSFPLFSPFLNEFVSSAPQGFLLADFAALVGLPDHTVVAR
jgi:hypothetical protein